MKKKSKFLTFALASLMLCATFYSCKEQASETTSTSEDFNQSSRTNAVADTTKTAVERTFVRAANLKFLTNDIQKSTNIIEKSVQKVGGYIALSDLQSNIVEKTETKISQDSLLESTKYTMSNKMTIRIPNQKLDIIIDTIEKQIAFLDSRNITQDDVSLQLLSNRLSQIRDDSQKNRLKNAIDSKGKKLNQIEDAEKQVADIDESKDLFAVKNASLSDQVNFSTINLEMCQREKISNILLTNPKNIAQYEPHLGILILDSIAVGWNFLELILLAIVKLWGLILICLLGIFIYRRRKDIQNIRL